jgi:hypothetical protein
MLESANLSLQAVNLLPQGLMQALPFLNGFGLVHTRIANDVAGPMTEIIDFGPQDKIPWGVDATGQPYLGFGPIEARHSLIPDTVANDHLAWEVPLPANDNGAVMQTLSESSGHLADWMAGAGITYNPLGFGARHANSNEAMAGLLEVNDIGGVMPPVDVWGIGHISEGVQAAVAALDPTFTVGPLFAFAPQILSIVSSYLPFNSFFASPDAITGSVAAAANGVVGGTIAA